MTTLTNQITIAAPRGAVWQALTDLDLLAQYDPGVRSSQLVGEQATGLGAQDAILRSGIAQVVSMNKRGTAFGTFNAAWGVLWFLGSVTMGVLYDFSLVALVVFGISAQLAAAVLFIWLRRPLAEAKRTA